MKAQRSVAAAVSCLFLLGYAVNGMGTGAVMAALGLFSWAVWPREQL